VSDRKDPPRAHDLPRGVFGLFGELRAPLEAARFWLARPRAGALPRGDGHPVVLLPGFGMGEEAMRPLGNALAALGHDVHGWGEGRNWGLRAPTLRRLVAAIDDLATRHGRRVSLVGWSAGGLYAREIARRMPDAVRRVVTFGAPIHGHAHGRPEVERFRGLLDGLRAARGEAVVEPDPDPPPVPVTAIHSRSDAVVAWQASLETGPDADNVEVGGSHFALGMNAEVLAIVAERLARPDRQV
jgi:pimeloyl-ACP methyl ester carboxylesterase